MTPQERALVDDLFDRLAKLESAPRDPEAEQAIRAGLAKSPHALYALVQSVLVQDEALKRADARIRELQGDGDVPDDGRPRGFLDNMRDALFGGGGNRGSVPTVRPAPAAGPAAYAQPAYAQPPYAQPSYSSGGSFLGTAAAAAAGVIGGSLLLSSIRNMMGNSYGNQSAFGDTFSDTSANAASSPWSDASNSDLARDAGLNDIGSRNTASDDSSSSSQGLFDTASNDSSYDDSSFSDDVGGGDTA
jgi:hypothetical protein